MKRHLLPKVAFLVHAILAVSGCATPSSLSASSSVNSDPVPTNYRRLVQEYMAPRLVDAKGARYEAWDAPVETYFWAQTGSGVAWRVDVSIDDKDPAGNYPAGLKRYRFVLSDGKVVSQEELQGADCVSAACPSDDNGVNNHRSINDPAREGSNSDHARNNQPDPPSHSTF